MEISVKHLLPIAINYFFKKKKKKLFWEQLTWVVFSQAKFETWYVSAILILIKQFSAFLSSRSVLMIAHKIFFLSFLINFC